ncbi:MAG TPA: beta-ketoacyl synthase N-terminal-like domain-containing protein [Thermodesulfobacteriota bacterium]
MDERTPCITGIGLVTTWGRGADAAWEALAGRRPAGRRWVPDDGPPAAFAAALPDEYEPHPNIPARIAPLLDRGGAIALDAALQAVETAGFGPGSADARRFGVVDAIAYRAPGQPTLYVPYGQTVARALGIRGPVLTVGGGEAASASAIALAARLVAKGEVEVALAGGAQALQQPLIAHLRELGAAEGPARPFDRSHAGFVPGEGAAYVVLERLEHAAARGREPLACIVGAGMTFDGSAEPFAFADPSESGRALQAALADAGYLQGQVDLVVSGADGRVQRDFCEGYALRRTFGRHAYYASVTAPAGSLGTPLAAQGAVAVAVAVECLARQQVPPIAGFEEPEPDLELAYARELRAERLDCVLVTSFAPGGTSVALLLERPHRP